VDRFRSGSWQEERGMPLLADAQANIYCEVDLPIPFATHTIFIARVIEARVSGTVRPLIYLDGRPCSAARVSHPPIELIVAAWRDLACGYGHS
jgi:flavin reductase (DIM6/NTAB) family NADH-FMN oxidoreductase RutF